MNGIDNLALYKTVDELQESKNSIERRTGIDFSKNVQQFDLLLDIIGEETPETEEKIKERIRILEIKLKEKFKEIEELKAKYL